MKTLFCLAFAACAWADTMTVSIQDVLQNPEYSEYGWSATGQVEIPGFNSSLGTLESVAVDWTLSETLAVNYITGPVDYSAVALDFTATTTAEAFGIAGSGSEETSEGVTASDCYDCWVPADVSATASGTITSPEVLEYLDTESYAAFSDSVSAEVAGAFDPSGAYVTGQIMWPSSYEFSGTSTYLYATTPEPRLITVAPLSLLAALLGLNVRRMRRDRAKCHTNVVL